MKNNEKARTTDKTFIASQQKHDIKLNIPNTYNTNYMYYARWMLMISGTKYTAYHQRHLQTDRPEKKKQRVRANHKTDVMIKKWTIV